jgi:hypothetical protein
MYPHVSLWNRLYACGHLRVSYACTLTPVCLTQAGPSGLGGAGGDNAGGGDDDDDGDDMNGYEFEFDVHNPYHKDPYFETLRPLMDTFGGGGEFVCDADTCIRLDLYVSVCILVLTYKCIRTYPCVSVCMAYVCTCIRVDLHASLFMYSHELVCMPYINCKVAVLSTLGDGVPLPTLCRNAT